MVAVTDVIEGLVESFFGLELPKGDPAGCRAAALHLRDLAGYVGEVRERAGQVTGEISYVHSGQTINAFRSAAADTGQRLAAVAALAQDLATALDDYASQVEAAQQRVKEIIEEIATTVTVGVLFGFVSDGLGDLLAAPRVIAAVAAIAGELSAFGEAVATVAARLAVYSIDSALWGLADRGSQSAVAAANGHPVDDPFSGGQQSADARIAYDAANDGARDAMRGLRTVASDLPGPFGRIARALPADPNANLATRAIARMGASSLAYTPVLNSERGKDDLLPTQAELEQKALTNLVGRVLVDQIRRG
ncbi:MAG TPA: hypothetical protein VHC49_11510 [Mycobacteriales bacterium]|nr:hypothetical protein [Mycobacteriales bacterium]